MGMRLAKVLKNVEVGTCDGCGAERYATLRSVGGFCPPHYASTEDNPKDVDDLDFYEVDVLETQEDGTVELREKFLCHDCLRKYYKVWIKKTEIGEPVLESVQAPLKRHVDEHRQALDVVERLLSVVETTHPGKYLTDVAAAQRVLKTAGRKGD